MGWPSPIWEVQTMTHLQPKWGPLFWLENALVLRGWPSKIEVIWVPRSPEVLWTWCSWSGYGSSYHAAILLWCHGCLLVEQFLSFNLRCQVARDDAISGANLEAKNLQNHRVAITLRGSWTGRVYSIVFCSLFLMLFWSILCLIWIFDRCYSRKAYPIGLFDTWL